MKIVPTPLSAAFLATATLGGPALAGCPAAGTPQETCTGSLPSGAHYAQPTQTLIVEDLNADVGGSVQLNWYVRGSNGNGTAGVTAYPLTLWYTGGSYSLAPNDTTGFALQAMTHGGIGSAGNGADKLGSASSGKGGDGGGGNDIVVKSSGSIAPTARAQQPGISLIAAQSLGGAAGRSDEATSRLASASGGRGGIGGPSGLASTTLVSGSLGLEQGGPASYGMTAESLAGKGGDGGEASAGSYFKGSADGGDGGIGGTAGVASVVIESGSISVSAPTGGVARAISIAGTGGAGGEGEIEAGTSRGGTGGAGGAAGPANMSIGDGVEFYAGNRATTGLSLVSAGGLGGVGGAASSNVGGNSYGGTGGAGGAGGAATFELGKATLTADGEFTGSVVSAQSLGGRGGMGGSGDAGEIRSSAYGGGGGVGGDGGTVRVSSGDGPMTVITTSKTSAVYAFGLESIAGAGGNGGNGHAHVDGDSRGGNGGPGGSGGTITADIWATATTSGPQALGVLARSYGGAGGNGGSADTTIGKGNGGAGAGSGPGGDVALSYQGSITTSGDDALGILAQSVGGFSGAGGDASGIVTYGAGSESAGSGGTVAVTLADDATIATSGTTAYGIQAHSVGGGGGHGGSAGGIASL
ncbi:MAG TPA: hypothetical protein VFN28_03785, partial [Amaricoccus sp.]|nr:hypothetical protein [Amaricoccus sp.]